MTIIIPPVPLPPFGGQAYNHITPFTYRDGLTYVEVLESLRAYIRDVLAPHFDSSFEELEGYVDNAVSTLSNYIVSAINANDVSVDSKITELGAYVNTQVALIIASAIEVQDSVVAGIMNNAGSNSRSITDALYVKSSEQVAGAAGFNATVPKRDSQPVVMVGVGNSHVAGAGASGLGASFLSLLANSAQATYPLATGKIPPSVVSLATAVSSPPSEPGLQMVRAGVGGSQSFDYMTATTRGQIGALQPSFILHMVSGNSARHERTPAIFKTDLISQLDALDALITVPHSHVLIHDHSQNDAGWTVTPEEYAEYGVQLAALAGERDNVMYINVSEAFSEVGVPGADPLTLLVADQIHMTDAGHALTADIIRKALGWLPTTTVLTQPSPTTYRVRSDGFTGDGEIIGRITDNFQGGETVTWVGEVPGRVETAGGVLRATATASSLFAGIPIPDGDIQASAVLTSAPTLAAILALNTQSTLTSTLPIGYWLSINATTNLFAIQYRDSGVSTTLASSTIPASELVGKRLTLRNYRGILSALIDGVQVLSVAEPAAALDGGWAGFLKLTNGDGSPWWDSFVVDSLI